MYHRENRLSGAEIPSPLFAIWSVLDDGALIQPNPLLATVRSLFLLGVTLVLIGPYLLLFRLAAARQALNGLWQAAAVRACGLDVEVTGEAVATARRLTVCNHVSYLDIPVLASLMPEATFIAKAEVKSWPVFGILARLARTAFIRREPTQAAAQRTQLQRRLDDGDSLILFAEGTSSDGTGVLPFKSALFSLAEQVPGDEGFVIQPVSIAYTRLADGRPLIGGLEDFYAWHGDMTLGPHLGRVLGLRGAKVRVHFHEPIAVEAGMTRKALANVTHAKVSEGVQRARSYWLG